MKLMKLGEGWMAACEWRRGGIRVELAGMYALYCTVSLPPARKQVRLLADMRNCLGRFPRRRRCPTIMGCVCRYAVMDTPSLSLVAADA